MAKKSPTTWEMKWPWRSPRPTSCAPTQLAEWGLSKQMEIPPSLDIPYPGGDFKPSTQTHDSTWTLDGNRLRLEIPGEDAVPPLVRKLVEAGAEIVEVRLIGADLEQLYLEIVEGRT